MDANRVTKEMKRLKRISARPPRGIAAHAWPFIQIVAIAGSFCIAYYAVLDIIFDWHPQSWEAADRLVLIGKSSFFAALPVLVVIIIAAAQRLDPRYFDGKDVRRDSVLDINTRYVQNSVEQLVIFFFGLTGIGLQVTEKDAQAVPILASLFVLGRVLYWYGYHHNTFIRAFGFGLTCYPTLIVFGWVLLVMLTGFYFPI